MSFLLSFLLTAIFLALGLKTPSEAFQMTEMSIDDYLGKHLSSYDMITPSHIIGKRNIGMDTKSVEFTAFNKTFSLVLEPMQLQPVSKDFVVQMSDSTSGEFSVINASDILVNSIFYGFVDGEPYSKVSGYFANNKLISTIWTSGGILNIEPISAITGNVSDSRLLAFYDHQLRDRPDRSEPNWCGTEDATPRPTKSPRPQQPPSNKRSSTSGRQTRSAPTDSRRVCRLQMVADHVYFQRIGMREIGTTVRSMVKMIDDINQIFEATVFVDPDTHNPLPRLGFELSSVLVLQHATNTTVRGHFNAELKKENLEHTPGDVLSTFSSPLNRFNFSAYCLNHLLTFRRMERNVLGQAHVKGACQIYMFTRGKIYLNTGFTTYSDGQGYPLLLRRAVLVTAHELGHNVGTNHDPVGKPECLPEPVKGGPFIMHEKSVFGTAGNNDKFSPCSIKEISEYAVDYMLSSCLALPNPRLCGNHRLDPGEQCDSGAGGDACCTAGCRLTNGSVCSDSLHGCCQGCKVASNDTVCLAGPSLLRPCHMTALCDGVLPTCPESLRTAPDGAPCDSGLGRCLSGACVSACHPLQPCVCLDRPCQLCCAASNGTCATLARAGHPPIRLPAQTRCPRGHCDSAGHCVAPSYFEENSGRPAVRIFQMGRQPGGGLFSNNLVFIAVAATLLLWVPACLIWHYRSLRLTGVTDNPDNEADITFDVST